MEFAAAQGVTSAVWAQVHYGYTYVWMQMYSYLCKDEDTKHEFLVPKWGRFIERTNIRIHAYTYGKGTCVVNV